MQNECGQSIYKNIVINIQIQIQITRNNHIHKKKVPTKICIFLGLLESDSLNLICIPDT